MLLRGGRKPDRAGCMRGGTPPLVLFNNVCSSLRNTSIAYRNKIVQHNHTSHCGAIEHHYETTYSCCGLEGTLSFSNTLFMFSTIPYVVDATETIRHRLSQASLTLASLPPFFMLHTIVCYLPTTGRATLTLR